MNAIRTIDMIPCVTNFSGLVSYLPIGFGLFVIMNEMTKL